MTSALHPAISAAAAPIRQRALVHAARNARQAEEYERQHEALAGCHCPTKRVKANAFRRAAANYRRNVAANIRLATDLTDYRAPSDTNDTLAHNLARLAASCT